MKWWFQHNKIKCCRNYITGDHLETVAEQRQRWASIRIMYFTVFLMSLGFSIVLTGLWPYLRQLDKTATKDFMGFVVAAHPFSQMLFSPLVGWWGNKLGKIRLPLITTIVVFIFASSMYSSIEVFESYRKYWILIARIFVGGSAANMALCRSYISAATKYDERTRAVSMISLAQLLGFIVGPGLQAAVTPLGDSGYRISPNFIALNMYTAAGWLNVTLGVINFILVLPVFFKEKPIAAREAMLLTSAINEREAWKSVKPDYISVWTLVVAFFILSFNFVLLESLGAPLTMDQFAWSNKEALSYLGILLSVGGIIACFTSALINRISQRFGELPTLLWGSFLLMVLGRVTYIPWGSDPPLIAYPQLQNALHEARMYHTNVHALYYKYKCSYDSLVKLTPQEVDRINKCDLWNTINVLTKRFWNSIELLANIFCSVSNLVLLKEDTQKDLEISGKLYFLDEKELDSCMPLKENQTVPSSESNIKPRPLDINADLEWQIKAFNASIAYAKHNMMKFKLATHHAPEFMNRIRDILRWPHSKWNSFKLKGLQKNLKRFKKQERILLDNLEKLIKSVKTKGVIQRLFVRFQNVEAEIY